MDVKFIFDSLRLGLSSSANILQIADVALRVVFLLFLPCFQLFFGLVLTLETSEMSAIFSSSQPKQLNLCGITLRNKVQKLQNRAARVLTYSSYDVDAGHLFKLLGWKNLACQQQFQRATMVYRSLHGLAPNYLSSKFERREVAYNLRDSENKLNVPLPRTNYYKNSFSYSGAILWNSLPCNLREAESLGQFKRLLKEL